MILSKLFFKERRFFISFSVCFTIVLSLILGKAMAAYEFSESREKINNLLFMGDLKLNSRNEKGLDSLVQTIRVFSEDIGMEFGVAKCAIY